MSKNPVDDLIADLAEELEPCRALSHPFARALVWILGALAYVGLVCYVMDVRPDVMTALSNHVFLFEVILMIGVFKLTV